MGVIQRQGIKNAVIVYFGVIIAFVNILIVQPNFLPKEELGLIRILFSFSILMSTFLPIGINSATLRFFPHFRNEATRHYGYFAYMMIFPMIGFVVLSILLFVFKSAIVGYYRSEEHTSELQS